MFQVQEKIYLIKSFSMMIWQVFLLENFIEIFIYFPISISQKTGKYSFKPHM